jgi:large subunit ribosomal protein L5
VTTERDKVEDQGSGQAASDGATGRRSMPRTNARTGAKATSGTGRKRTSAAGAARRKPAKSPSSRSGAAKGKAKAQKGPETAVETARVEPRPLPRVQVGFRQVIAPAMMKEFSYTSPMQVPRLSKIVLNIGLGEALDNPKAIESATRDLSLISGQRPVTTRARKSIAAFKVREGMALGLAVSLRGRRMFEFFDRLVSSALPRIRDFRGVSREAFDGRGNYSLGIREQVNFPEIEYNAIDRIRGLQVTIVTTAPTDREGLRLLELLGVPFERPQTTTPAV